MYNNIDQSTGENMKNWILIPLLLFLLLSACATTTPTENNTAILPTIPVDTPTLTPTITITPSATPRYTLGLPQTLEGCTSEIRPDHFNEDIQSLNGLVIRELPLDFQISMYSEASDWNPTVTINPLPYIVFSARSGYSNTPPVFTCARYLDGYAFGVVLQVQEMKIPVQIFMDPKLMTEFYEYMDTTGDDPVLTLIDRYNTTAIVEIYITLWGNFGNTAQYADTTTVALLKDLDEQYEYSGRVHDLWMLTTSDVMRLMETISMMERILLPGIVRIGK
jgi:hypothetical protein